jgi:hypothetical protein
LVKSSTNLEAGIFPEDSLKLQKLYYVSGWLLRAAEMESQRRRKDSTIRNQLTSLVELGEVANEDELSDLPYNEVATTDAFGGLKYPNQMFFTFVAMLENCCVHCLTANNIIVFRPYIVGEMKRELNVDLNVRTQLRDCCLLDSIEDVKDICEYLIRTYLRMRGKDFVRRIMSSSRRSRSTQHRHEQAAISNPKLHLNKNKRKSKQEKKKNQETKHDGDRDRADLEIQSRIMHSIVVDIVDGADDSDSDDDAESDQEEE